MPPKPKFTRDQIISAAFEIARAHGLEAVAAREVGRQLGTSATPIFTFFSGMDELKAEVKKHAQEMLLDSLSGVFDYRPAFKEFGMRWVAFAIKEPELYKMLFDNDIAAELLFSPSDNSPLSPLILRIAEEISKSFGVGHEDAWDILNQMLIHANGIAAFCIGSSTAFSADMISRSLSSVCIGLVISAKLRSGSFEPELARRMAESVSNPIVPQKINDYSPAVQAAADAKE